MKTKNRLLLTSAMMLALVAVSGTTATYAWFQVGRDATASLNNITAGTDAALTLVIDTTGCDAFSATDALTLDSGATLTDVTSQTGKNGFKKAKFNGQGTITSLADVTAGAAYATNVYYTYSFKATLSMEITSSETYALYLGGGDRDSAAAVVSGTNYTDFTRVCAYNDTSTVIYTGTEKTATNTKYQSSADATAAVTSAVINNSATARQDGTKKTAEVGYFGTLSKTTTSIEINFNIYLEGADTPTAIPSSGAAAISLYFYAVQL